MESSHINKPIIWHTAVLPRETVRALDTLAHKKWLKQGDWYLGGGTALALYAGHRQSVDLDFFTPRGTFAVGPLFKYLNDEKWITDHVEKGTLYGRLHDAKISFIAYPFFLRAEQPQWYGTVRVLEPADIAVMKIIAISQRGRKRDFVDLFWYVKNTESLIAVIKKLPHQYPNVAHNYHHILESLMYFDDAEADPMPKLFFKADWREIKTYFRKEVPKITKELLRLT